MSSASGRKLPQSTYDAVVKLCQDKANTVFIVSGLNDKGLMQVSHRRIYDVCFFMYLVSVSFGASQGYSSER